MLRSQLSATKAFGLIVIFAFGTLVTIWSCDVAAADGLAVPTEDFNGLYGDVNQDEIVDFFDIPAFIDCLRSGDYHPAADMDLNCKVDFFDIPLFIRPGLQTD